jgi:hypothetical protein
MKLQQTAGTPLVVPFELSNGVSHVLSTSRVVVHAHSHMAPSFSFTLPVFQSRERDTNKERAFDIFYFKKMIEE